MINEKLVHQFIGMGKYLPETPQMPSHEHGMLALRVTLEELFEQAEAFGPEFLREFARISIEASERQQERADKGDLNTGIVALRDAIADTFVTACNMPSYAGLIYQVEPDYNEVMRSNFTKFCTTEEDAQASVDAYAQQGRKTIYQKKGDYYVISDADTGKILKGIHYQEPNLV